MEIEFMTNQLLISDFWLHFSGWIIQSTVLAFSKEFFMEI